MGKRWHENWEGFQEGRWNQSSVNVRDFIQKNYTQYSGDESFLEGTTDKTNSVWNKCKKKSYAAWIIAGKVR